MRQCAPPSARPTIADRPRCPGSDASVRVSSLLRTLSVLAVCALWPLEALAVAVVVPSGLNPGDQYQLAFVTTSRPSPGSSDIGDYNTFVQSVADAYDLGVGSTLFGFDVSWNALASTPSVDAKDNVALSAPLYRLDDIQIASGEADLFDGSILAAILTLEDGSEASARTVWTGSNSDGTGEAGFELGNAFVVQGLATSATLDGRWIADGGPRDTSDFLGHMYAVSEVLTVVPEPSGIVLVAIGIAALAGRRGRDAT